MSHLPPRFTHSRFVPHNVGLGCPHLLPNALPTSTCFQNSHVEPRHESNSSTRHARARRPAPRPTRGSRAGARCRVPSDDPTHELGGAEKRMYRVYVSPMIEISPPRAANQMPAGGVTWAISRDAGFDDWGRLLGLRWEIGETVID